MFRTLTVAAAVPDTVAYDPPYTSDTWSNHQDAHRDFLESKRAHADIAISEAVGLCAGTQGNSGCLPDSLVRPRHRKDAREGNASLHGSLCPHGLDAHYPNDGLALSGRGLHTAARDKDDPFPYPMESRQPQARKRPCGRGSCGKRISSVRIRAHFAHRSTSSRRCRSKMARSCQPSPRSVLRNLAA